MLLTDLNNDVLLEICYFLQTVNYVLFKHTISWEQIQGTGLRNLSMVNWRLRSIVGLLAYRNFSLCAAWPSGMRGLNRIVTPISTNNMLGSVK